MSVADKAIFSGFFGTVFTPLFTYFTEWLYLRLIKKYKHGKRTPEIYHALHWTLTAGFLVMICAILGYDRYKIAFGYIVLINTFFFVK